MNFLLQEQRSGAQCMKFLSQIDFPVLKKIAGDMKEKTEGKK